MERGKRERGGRGGGVVNMTSLSSALTGTSLTVMTQAGGNYDGNYNYHDDAQDGQCALRAWLAV